MATKNTKVTAKRKPGEPKKVDKAQESGGPIHPLKLNGKDWNRDKVMDHVCDNLATSSNGIGSILSAGFGGHDLPSYSTLMKWLDEDKALSDKYTRAKEAQADFMADEMLDIADNGAEEPLVVNGVPLQVNGELVKVKSNPSVQHARLRVETRKWLASKLKPKKYGEKTEIEHSGSIQTLSDEQVDTRLAALMSKAKG